MNRYTNEKGVMEVASRSHVRHISFRKGRGRTQCLGEVHDQTPQSLDQQTLSRGGRGRGRCSGEGFTFHIFGSFGSMVKEGAEFIRSAVEEQKVPVRALSRCFSKEDTLSKKFFYAYCDHLLQPGLQGTLLEQTGGLVPGKRGCVLRVYHPGRCGNCRLSRNNTVAIVPNLRRKDMMPAAKPNERSTCQAWPCPYSFPDLPVCVNVKATRFFVDVVIVSTSVGSFFFQDRNCRPWSREPRGSSSNRDGEGSNNRRRWFSIDLQKLFQGQAQAQEHRRTCPFCLAVVEPMVMKRMELGPSASAWTRFLYTATSGDRTHWMEPIVKMARRCLTGFLPRQVSGGCCGQRSAFSEWSMVVPQV